MCRIVTDIEMNTEKSNNVILLRILLVEVVNGKVIEKFNGKSSFFQYACRNAILFLFTFILTKKT